LKGAYFFIARGYAERGIATEVACLSVCLSVRDVQASYHKLTFR